MAPTLAALTDAHGAAMAFPAFEFLVVLAALCFLMFVAYRGYSVILFAPVAALGAVLLTDPQLVAPMFTGLFMDKMVGFLKLYFPVFLLGAIFGKVIELSGFSKSIVSATIRLVGAQRAILAIVAVCALLTYGGVSLFVVVFAVYPFAAELFRQSDIPKRLIPGTIALGAFTFTMDALPGTPQIQNIIPTTFFGTNTWAAPVLGTLGGVFILIVGLLYLDWRRRAGLYKLNDTLANLACGVYQQCLVAVLIGAHDLADPDRREIRGSSRRGHCDIDSAHGLVAFRGRPVRCLEDLGLTAGDIHRGDDQRMQGVPECGFAEPLCQR